MSSSPFNPLSPGHYAPQEHEIEQGKRTGKRVGIFFATREGHTRQIAERIMDDLRKHGFDVDLQDVHDPLAFDLARYGAAVLAASVHQGGHEKEIVQFVRNHRSELVRLPTAFISVTLSEAGVERPKATPAEHAQFVGDVHKMMNKFYEDTQWYPTYAKPVAGALLYSKYNFFLRFIMKQIARKAGAATDTSRDYDYTDWAGLDRFIEDFAKEIRASVAASEQPARGQESRSEARSANHV